MRLVRLKLTNFRQITSGDAILPDGLIGIVGENGAGKCLPGWVRVYDPVLGEAVEISRFVKERRRQILGYVDGALVPVDVLEWHQVGDKRLVRLTLANGMRWSAAATHPLMCPEGFKEAGTLAPGDQVAEVGSLPGFGPARVSAATAAALGAQTDFLHPIRPPGDILLQPVEVCGAYLAGLWQTSGHLAPTEISCLAGSEAVALNIRLLLLRLGVASSIEEGVIRSRPSWTVSVPTLQYRRLRRAFSSPRPRARLKVLPEPDALESQSDIRDFVRVVSVEETGEIAPCYDVTIDSPEHVYLADTFLVHNSGTTEAVGIALHGLAAIREGHTKEDLVRDDTTEDVKIELEWALGEHLYRVTRVITAKDLSSRADLWRDGVKIATGADGVTAKITELIGSLDEFRLSRFVRQDQLNELSSLQPVARKKTVLRLMGVDAVETALVDLRHAIADIDRNVRARQALLPDLDDLVIRIAALGKDRKRIHADYTAAGGKIAGLEKLAEVADARSASFEAVAERLAHSTATRALSADALAEIEARLTELDASDVRLAQVADSLAQAQTELADAQAHRAELSDLERVAALRDSAVAMRAQREALEVRIAELSAEHNRLATQAAREADLVRAAAAAVATAQQAARDNASALSTQAEQHKAGERAQEDRRTFRLQLDRLEAGEKPERCASCGQPVPDIAVYREHLKAQLAAVETNLAIIIRTGVAARDAAAAAAAAQQAATTRGGQIEKDLAGVREAAAQDRVLCAALVERVAERDGVNASIAEAGAMAYDEERHGELSAEAAAVSSLLSLVASARGELSERERNTAERERLLARRAEHEARRAEAEAVMAAAGYSPAEHEAARAAARAAHEAVTAARVDQARVEGDLRVVDTALEAAREAERGFAAANADIRRMLDDRADLKLTLEWMDRFRTNLIGRLRPALSRKASRLLAILTDGRYTDLVLTSDYDMQFGMGSRLKAFKRASGGEADLLNLCLRLAVSELINETTGVGRTFLVLDEILGSQSTKRELAIMDLLPRLTAHFGQIIMIAHKPAAQDRFGSVIEVVFDEATETSTVFFPPGLAAGQTAA
jgi:exonuclease SbcC